MSVLKNSWISIPKSLEWVGSGENNDQNSHLCKAERLSDVRLPENWGKIGSLDWHVRVLFLGEIGELVERLLVSTGDTGKNDDELMT